MRKYLIILLLLIPMSIFAQDIGGDYYLVPPDSTYDGMNASSDANDGSYANPWATLQHAIDEMVAGDTLYIRGGVYFTNSPTRMNPENSHGASGESATNGIYYYGYPGEDAIFDCRYHCDSSSIQYNAWLSIDYVEHIFFKNFTVRNVYQCSLVNNGAISTAFSRHLHFENITIHNIGDRAFYLMGGAWKSWYEDDQEIYGGANGIPEPYFNDDYADSTTFLNCDVYNICDSISPNPGNAADAFKTIHYRGNKIYFIGCRAWNYTDDMIDPSLVNGGEWFISNNWAMPGGGYKVIYTDAFPDGDATEQNGIKVSSNEYRDPPLSEHYGIVSNNVVLWAKQGFTILQKSKYEGNFIFYNNTAYGCEASYYSTGGGSVEDPRTYIMRNNIDYASTGVSAISGWYGVVLMGENDSDYPESNNTWDWYPGYPDAIITDTVTVTDADFVTVDSLTLISLFTAPRQADGSLPVARPLMLAPGSDLIDAGTQVKSTDSTDYVITYYGDAPDIGYYEYGSLDSTKTGILSFVFTEQTGIATIDTVTGTPSVDIEVEYGTDVSALTPTITLDYGATVSPLSGVETDFTDPVTYTVTALNGVTTKEYTVTVTVATSPDPPTVILSAPTARHTRLGYANANVTDDGGGTVLARGVCWSTSESPTTSDSKTTRGTGTGAYSNQITGLNANTTYYVRAYATNENGTAYSSQRSFTTPEVTLPLSGTKVLNVGGVLGILK
jgi:hypothetical protein